jgi:glycosyltransferase involved in cell wall biosynthesis
MRILYFSRDYTPHDHRFLAALSGTEHQVDYLRLEQRGHQLEDRPLPVNIRQVPWAGGSHPVGWREGLSLLRDLRRVIREIKPDIIHAGPIQRPAFLSALAGFRPLVSMSWGYDLLQDANRGALWSWATRYTLKRSAALVGDCETVRHRAVTFGMPVERIITFPWGIDLDHFTPSGRSYAWNECTNEEPPTDYPQTQASRPFTLLSTRSWEPIYGVEFIARAFATIARQRPEIRLIMLGNGSQASMLRQIFLSAGVEQQVYFPGQVGYSALPEFYRSADLYLSASHSDGTSISLLEALGCGCPALVSDIPGNREWVTPGEQGWWFPDGDVESLTSTILKAFEQPAQLVRMGRSARFLAEQRADWRKNFPHLLEAYQLACHHSSVSKKRVG